MHGLVVQTVTRSILASGEVQAVDSYRLRLCGLTHHDYHGWFRAQSTVCPGRGLRPDNLPSDPRLYRRVVVAANQRVPLTFQEFAGASAFIEMAQMRKYVANFSKSNSSPLRDTAAGDTAIAGAVSRAMTARNAGPA